MNDFFKLNIRKFYVIRKGYIPAPFDNFVFKKNKKFPHASKTM